MYKRHTEQRLRITYYYRLTQSVSHINRDMSIMDARRHLRSLGIEELEHCSGMVDVNVLNADIARRGPLTYVLPLVSIYSHLTIEAE